MKKGKETHDGDDKLFVSQHGVARLRAFSDGIQRGADFSSHQSSTREKKMSWMWSAMASLDA
jgi:hypothetical protein